MPKQVPKMVRVMGSREGRKEKIKGFVFDGVYDV